MIDHQNTPSRLAAQARALDYGRRAQEMRQQASGATLDQRRQLFLVAATRLEELADFERATASGERIRARIPATPALERHE